MPRRPAPSADRAVVDESLHARRRLDRLEQPDGNQLARALDKVLQLITDLPGLVTAFLAGGFSTGAISATHVTLSGYLFTPAGYAFDITGTRRGAWLENNGRLGWASSSITKKMLIDTLEPPDAVKALEILPHYYQRLAELEKRDDPTSENYVGPDYHVATEWGGIAEEFHDAGLWQVVVYEWDVVHELRDVLDAKGKPIVNREGLHAKERIPGSERRVKGSEPRPIGIHYELLGLLAMWAAQHVWTEHLQLVKRVEDLESQGL